MQGRVWAVVVCLLTAFYLPAGVAVARGDELADGVAQLLETGWKPTASQEALSGQFEQLQKLAPQDGRVIYAFALVELKSRRYDDATKLLAEAAAASKDDPAPRRARVWLLMLMKKYPAALVEMESLAKSFPEKDAGGETEESYRDAARFMGRMFAFLEGPMAGAVVDHAVSDSRDKVTARLTPPRRMAFDEANRALARRFATLDHDREQTQDDAKAAEQNDLDRARAGVDHDRQRLAAEQKSLDAKAGKLRTDLKTDLASIDAGLQQLDARYAQTNGAAANANQQALAAQQQIAQLLALADNSRDPAEQTDLRSQAAQLQGTVAAAFADLRALNADVADLNARRAALVAQRRIVLGQNRDEFDGIQRRTAEIAVADRRLQTDAKKLRQPATGNTAKVHALTAQATALTTYEEFPFDSERQRLLQAFGK